MTKLDAHHILAEKDYNSHAILDHIEASGARPIIPKRICMPRQRDFARAAIAGGDNRTGAPPPGRASAPAIIASPATNGQVEGTSIGFS